MFVVVAALIALVVIPPLITERNTALRQDLLELYSPLGTHVSSLERTTGAELAAARAYALTGDPFFVDRFLAMHEYGNRVARGVDSLASELGGEVMQASDQLLRTKEQWTAANFGRTRASFRENLPEHQEHFEAMMRAAQRLREVLAREVEAHNRRIAHAERARDRVTALLALVALLAAGAALWLARRLQQSEHHILRRARDEATLRRIAQTMAEAEDLQGALQRIVGAVAEVAGADGAHIEQVDHDRNQIEVIAAIGEGAPAIGNRAAYSGSAVERVLASGKAERTGIDEMAPREGQDGKLPDAGNRHSRFLIVPLVSEGEPLGALTLDRAPPKPAFDAAEARRTRLLADMAALVLRRLRLFEEVRRQEQKLRATAAELRTVNETLEERVQDRTRTVRQLSRELTLAEQRERRAVAQVLHDDLQQLLFALQLQLQSLETSTASLPEDVLRGELRRAHDVVGEAMSTTRRLTVDLSPPVQAGATFVDALRWLAAHTRERFGLDVEIQVADDLSIPADDLRLLLFQIVRELLFNVVKHAGTGKAVITVSALDGHLVVEVTDEGVGFDPAKNPAQTTSTSGGFGLRRAKERLALFGGGIQVEPKPGGGTRARVMVPMDRLLSD